MRTLAFIILGLTACLSLFAQQLKDSNDVLATDIRVIYIGSEPCCGEDILMTSGPFRGDYLNYTDPRHTKMYYIHQDILNAIRLQISSSKWVSRSDPFTAGHAIGDTLLLLDAYKIAGVDARPLYVRGKGCLDLFSSVMQFLAKSGLWGSAGFNAMHQIEWQLHEDFFRRHIIDLTRFQQIDTFRMNPTPPNSTLVQNIDSFLSTLHNGNVTTVLSFVLHKVKIDSGYLFVDAVEWLLTSMDPEKVREAYPMYLTVKRLVELLDDPERDWYANLLLYNLTFRSAVSIFRCNTREKWLEIDEATHFTFKYQDTEYWKIYLAGLSPTYDWPSPN